MPRFKPPLERLLFFPGKNKKDNDAVKSILKETKFAFREMSKPFCENKKPVIVYNGRPYYGINEIKRVYTAPFSL